MARIFKNQIGGRPLFIRYKNRKLYCTQTSCYTTMTKVIELVESGENPVIFDKKISDEATGNILARELVEIYLNKLDLQPTLDDIRNLIELVKSWPRRTSGSAQKMVIPSLNRKPKNPVTVKKEIGEKAQLPFGDGNNIF